MAKQCGLHPFTGKMGATIGYKQKNGTYIERENGAKEGKAFKKDPRRWRTMYNAGLFAQAAKAIWSIYRALPKDQRQHGVYGKLSGKAFSMLRLGSSIEEVKEELIKRYVEDKVPLAAMTQSAKADVSVSLTASATTICKSATACRRDVILSQHPIFPDHPQYIVQQKENNQSHVYTFILRPDCQYT